MTLQNGLTALNNEKQSINDEILKISEKIEALNKDRNFSGQVMNTDINQLNMNEKNSNIQQIQNNNQANFNREVNESNYSFTSDNFNQVDRYKRPQLKNIKWYRDYKISNEVNGNIVSAIFCFGIGINNNNIPTS